MQTTRKYWLPAVVASLLFVFFLSCTTTDYVTGKETSNLFSIADDVRMGADMFKDSKKSLKSDGYAVNQDKKRLAQMQTILKRLATVSHLPDLPYEVLLVQDPETVNAMALPGGKFFVFEGLYDSKEGLVHSEAELAAVLGHEMAHVTCRHSTEEMTRNLPVELLLAGVSIYAELEEDEDLQEILDGAFLLYNGLWVTKYSRADEDEADRVGMMYMAKAGYNPEAAVQLWKKVADKEGGDWPVLSIFSTHPTSRHRYEALKKELPAAMALYGEAGKPESSHKLKGVKTSDGVVVNVARYDDDDNDSGLMQALKKHQKNKDKQ